MGYESSATLFYIYFMYCYYRFYGIYTCKRVQCRIRRSKFMAYVVLTIAWRVLGALPRSIARSY